MSRNGLRIFEQPRRAEGDNVIPTEIHLTGGIRDAQLVADRRGSRIWKVTLDDWRLLALKYTTDNDSAQGMQKTARLLATREARVLQHIGRDGYLYASGETENGSWIAVSWIEALTLAQRWRGVRTSGEPTARTSTLMATWLAADTLASLHAKGWRHADLQADHILIPDSGRAQLVDFALAQGPIDVGPKLAYRGALAHLTAPEIAEEILATPPDHHINLTAEAESYTFGAVLFTAWTKQWPFDYGADPRELSPEQIYARICQPRWRRPLPQGWPHMADLIASMMADAPADRPSVAEVRSSLSEQIDTGL